MRARAFLQLGVNKDEKRSNPRCKEGRGTFHLVVRSWCKPNRVNLIRLFAIVLLFCSYRPSYAIVVGEGFTPLGYAPFETRDLNWHAGVGGLNFGATPYCTAQPIARSILLTAAHCTSSFTTHFASRFSVDSTNDGEFDFDFGIQSYVDHPGWSNDGRATRSADEYRHDIAVLLLDGDLPLEVPIYRMLPVHYGAPVTLVGYGRQGITFGGSGAFIHDNDDLGATDKWLGHNVVDPYVTRNGTIPELFRTTFDRRSPSEFVTPPSGCVGPPGRQLCANPGVRAEGFGFQEGTTLQGDSGSGMFYNPASARFYTNPNGTGAPGGTSKLTPNEYFLVGIHRLVLKHGRRRAPTRV